MGSNIIKLFLFFWKLKLIDVDKSLVRNQEMKNCSIIKSILMVLLTFINARDMKKATSALHNASNCCNKTI